MTMSKLIHASWGLTAVVVIAAVAACLRSAQSESAAQVPALAMPGAIATAQWQPWRDRFTTADGRVLDDVNGNISHSEGQGYGLLLAVLAQDRATFARIWGFTQRELLVRDDGLAAWRWDPNSNPHVTDINDASDGDILIAYSLALAGETWQSPEYTAAARNLASAIGRVLVKRVGDRTVLMPAAKGYGAGERPDGPVVNLSYWIFEALPFLAQLAPVADWSALAESGRALLFASRFGPARLPSNWISIKTAAPTPAVRFDPEFGYDAIRIPLYLLRAGSDDRSLLEPFAKLWSAPHDEVGVVSLADGRTTKELSDPGYRMIAAALGCALDGKSIPPSLRAPTPTSYYPSTLHLLALSMVAQKYSVCL
jgi:endo-1,4-beta-D-glucanase Y